MSKVGVLNVKVHNGIAGFEDPFDFEITIHCNAELEDVLEWRVTYVGSATTEKYDQVLETVCVGPVPQGYCRFNLSAPAPNMDQIPQTELLGITVILLTGEYLSQEFVRVGYYVDNTIPEGHEGLITPEIIQRTILDTTPRITKYNINWSPNKEKEVENRPITQEDQEKSGDSQDCHTHEADETNPDLIPGEEKGEYDGYDEETSETDLDSVDLLTESDDEL